MLVGHCSRLQKPLLHFLNAANCCCHLLLLPPAATATCRCLLLLQLPPAAACSCCHLLLLPPAAACSCCHLLLLLLLLLPPAPTATCCCCCHLLLLPPAAPAGLVSATASTGTGSSYGALVRRTIGRRAEATLQFAVFANCYIMEVVFVVVLGDILIGTAPDFGGLLPEWVGVSPADCVWLRRDVVLGAMSLLVLLPLASMRSMERLAVVNIIGEVVGVGCCGYGCGFFRPLKLGAPGGCLCFKQGVI
jgi:hypothetical protein